MMPLDLIIYDLHRVRLKLVHDRASELFKVEGFEPLGSLLVRVDLLVIVTRKGQILAIVGKACMKAVVTDLLRDCLGIVMTNAGPAGHEVEVRKGPFRVILFVDKVLGTVTGSLPTKLANADKSSLPYIIKPPVDE